MKVRLGRCSRRIALTIGILGMGLALGGCDLLWPIPEIPTGVEASDGTVADRIVVTWDSVERATRYEVWRAESEDGPYTRVGETTETIFSDDDVAPNVIYWYQIRACNRGGCSPASAADYGHAVGEGMAPIPTGVSATDGLYTDRVRVTWNVSPGATEYQVWRGLTEGGVYTLAARVTGTTFDDTDVSPGRVYWYKVRACNALGCSPFSLPDSGLAFAGVPDPVTNVAATDGTHANRVVITWTGVVGVTTYEVHRATAEAGPFTRVGDSAIASFSDTAVVVGTTYWYRVRACNAAGCSAFSVPDAGHAAAAAGGVGPGPGPGPVPGHTTVSASDGQFLDRIRVTWSSVGGATRYEVLRSVDGVTFYQIAATTTALVFEDTFQTPTGRPTSCTWYWYAVRACNATGCGHLSVADRGYRGAPTPLPPTGVSATDGLHSDRITITWNAVPGARFYEIYMHTAATGVFTELGQTTSTTFHHTGLTPGVTRYYRVRACVDGVGDGICGCSGFSITDAGSTCSVPAAPSPPTAATAPPVPAGTIRLTWTVVTGLRYELWRSDTGAVGTYTRIAEFATSPYDDNVGTGQTRHYKLRACNACGCSEFSLPVSSTAQ